MTVTTARDADTDADAAEQEQTESAESETSDDTNESAIDEADTDAATGDDEDERPKRRWTRYAVISVATVLLLALLGGSGFLGWTVWQERQVNRAGQEAQQAAVSYAQILTSIDTAKVDENFNQVLDGATGEFKDMYSQSSMQLRQLLIDNKASAHGVVLDSAIQSQSKDRVVVLLFVDQSVSNASMPDPRIDRSRIKMTMENVDGRWRASKVELP